MEKQALDDGIDLLSPEYKQLQDVIREKILAQQGFTLEEYRAVKEQVAGISPSGTLAVMQDTQKKLIEVANRPIPTTEEITAIAEQVAKQYIVPPQIINKIVDRVTIKEPKIVKETFKIKEQYDPTPLFNKIDTVQKDLNTKIEALPTSLKMEEIQKEIYKSVDDFATTFKKNTDILNMPDFRRLALGLRQDIDSLKSSGGASGSITGLISQGTNVTITGTGTLADPYVINSSGGGAVSSVNSLTGAVPLTGTANRITVSAANVFDISASYVGQSSIITLGTITTGVWTGTAIANANLANSTISGVALGGTLAALTATDATLTFSGSYTGTTARTIGINLGNANTWTATQSLSSTSGGIAVYATTDQVTNYERLAIKSGGASSAFSIITENGGTGVLDNITLNGAGTQLNIGTGTGTGSNNAFTLRRDATSQNLVNITSSGIQASSGIQYGLRIDPTVNQSSTAGYTMLLVNPTESTTGSGTKLLADFQVGSSSKANIDNTGYITGLGLTTTGARTLAAWGVAGPNLQTVAANYTDSSTAAGATVSTIAANSIGIPTFTAANATSGSKVTYTSAYTFYIAGIPVAGTNTILTNPISLFVAAGAAVFNGGMATSANGGTSNFWSSPGTGIGGSATTAGLVFGGATTVAYRSAFFGNVSTTLAASSSYSSAIFASAPTTMASSGTVAWLNNVTINPLGTVTNASAITVTNTATLYVGAAGSGGTNNYGLYVAGNATFAGSTLHLNNAVTASGNAATVPVTATLTTVTNNSAATLTITITTTGAIDGQLICVRVLDATAAAQTITWTNTENSSVSATTTSNGSTTLPVENWFRYNGGTSKWRCILKA